MMYQEQLDAMIKAATPAQLSNYKPFIVEVMDVTEAKQLRPIWAKTGFDAFKQCIAQNSTDLILDVYTVPDGYQPES